MSGTQSITSNIYNLANRQTSSDVSNPGNTFGSTAFNALNASLYNFSSKNGLTNINAFTVFMQAVDQPGNTGSYYAVRAINRASIGTSETIYFGPMQLRAMLLNYN
jgi:hypothetical protein